MYLVAVHNWQKEEAAAAKVIAETLGLLVYEARQKIACGGPTVLASLAEVQRAEELVSELTASGIPAFVLDSAERSDNHQFHVRRFVLGVQGLQLESFNAEHCDISYDTIALLLISTSHFGQTHTTSTVTERKFSLGRTLATGGIPMTRKVMREETVTSEQREEALWLYSCGNPTMIFARAAMSYDGLGEALQVSRNLNFTHLKGELRRLAPQAGYEQRLLKRSGQVQVLGHALDPETHYALAIEVLARSLRSINHTFALCPVLS